ncbi:M13-type metalloendopeptidase [Lapidilactobacillus mulanensis]|uniref:M13-type metalloendopeptidase n=1 Tax=Lapidilactobacillus mulanensis TaxID=2485999 RepID=A0ABW4DPI1_9LACO|nr:M13 family metallopeptidase [Lapidilactobacillus mulanensis]
MGLPRIQDDLYLAVNGEWQDSTVIPADKSVVSADSDLTDNIRTKLVADLTKIAAGEEASDIPALTAAAQLYAKAADQSTRDHLGIQPIETRLQFLESLTSLTDFKAAQSELISGQYALPFDYFVMADFDDATKNILHLSCKDPILPDSALYQKDSADNQQMLAAWSKMATQLLAAAGYSSTQQQEYVADALTFDARTAQFVPTNEELADDKNINNPLTWAEFAEQTATIGLADAFADQLKQTPDKINTFSPKYVQNVATIFTAENYHEWQHFAIIQELINAAPFLSDELRKLGSAYRLYLSGQPEADDWVKQAYRITNRFLAEPIGVYYGRKYFGETAKQDITELVKQIIAQYEVQLRANTWLSDSTRQQAIEKLSTMKIKMGYPDAVFPMYQHLTVGDDTDLLTAVLDLQAQISTYRFATVGQPVDRSEWAMPGQLVNACYDPSKNDITFPAGILQPPFYSVDWTRAQNLGGTGATIGHEISHSFDNNGAMYNAQGNMRNWWTEADRAAFDQEIQAVADQFDGLDYEGAKVNGKLTVSENIADNAGMDVALDMLGQAATNADLQAFFIAYAKSWATKMRPEMAKTVLLQDVHAPATLRVNVPVKNFAEFYQAFAVKTDDAMYLDPAKRIVIWDK